MVTVNQPTGDTPEDPITHGGVPRGYKYCKCSACGTVRVCTPQFDFYTKPHDQTGPLRCEVCLLKSHNHIGYVIKGNHEEKDDA